MHASMHNPCAPRSAPKAGKRQTTAPWDSKAGVGGCGDPSAAQAAIQCTSKRARLVPTDTSGVRLARDRMWPHSTHAIPPGVFANHLAVHPTHSRQPATHQHAICTIAALRLRYRCLRTKSDPLPYNQSHTIRPVWQAGTAVNQTQFRLQRSEQQRTRSATQHLLFSSRLWEQK